MGIGDGPPPGEDRDAERSQPGTPPDAENLARLIQDAQRLDSYVERLRSEQAPTPPELRSDEDAAVYQLAARLHATGSDAAEPSDDFFARMRRQLQQHPDDSPAHVTDAPRPRQNVSRRGLLAGLGVAAAAGITAGVALDRIAQEQTPAQADTPWKVPLVPQGGWLAVASVASFPVGAVQRFATDQLVGYIRRTNTSFVALSGACTHMGCLLSWNATARTFDCPCHGGRFTEDGASAPSSPIRYRPLPTIKTKVEDGQVWVYVPVAQANAPTATPGNLYHDPTASGG